METLIGSAVLTSCKQGKKMKPFVPGWRAAPLLGIGARARAYYVRIRSILLTPLLSFGLFAPLVCPNCDRITIYQFCSTGSRSHAWPVAMPSHPHPPIPSPTPFSPCPTHQPCTQVESSRVESAPQSLTYPSLRIHDLILLCALEPTGLALPCLA